MTRVSWDFDGTRVDSRPLLGAGIALLLAEDAIMGEAYTKQA